MKRTFKDLVPGTAALRQRIRQVLSGGTIAGLGLTPAAANPSVAPVVTPEAPNALIVNKSQKTKKLILRLPSGESYKMLQHRSHASHASHYSGSSGGSPTTTTGDPSSSTPTTTASTPGKIEANSRFSGTITAIDHVKRTVTIKTASAMTYTIAYRDDTQFRATGTASSDRLDDLLAKSGKLPFEKGQKIDVTWRTSAGADGLIATLITKTP